MAREPSLDDALYLVEAHVKTGCMHPWAAFDYAHRVKGMDFDRMKRGWEFIVAGLKARAARRKDGV